MAQWHNTDVPFEMISPFAMPPPQYNTLQQDLSAPIAQSQLMRRLSTRSSTASNSSKRGSARVSKLPSTGSSPHYISRRRTTAAHSARSHEASRHSGEQKRSILHSLGPASNNVRPFSWHPASISSQTTPEDAPFAEQSMGSAISGFENLAVTNISHSTAQQSIHNAFAMGYGSYAGTGSLYPQFTLPQYSNIGPDLQQNHYPYPSVPYNEPFPSQAPQTYPSPARSTDQWQSSANLSMNPIAALAPAKSESRVECDPGYLQTKQLPDTLGRGSEELVGIGLYDNTDNGRMSTRAIEVRNESGMMTGGKELKLEEMWQPPPHDEQDEESSDDIEEAEEVPEEVPQRGEGQAAVYPTYGDLSNQSFLFMDEVESLPSSDQYTDYHIFNNDIQGFNLSMEKPQPADLGHALWF